MTRGFAVLFFALSLDAGVVFHAGNLSIPRAGHSSFLLPDGRVAVIGGGTGLDILGRDLRVVATLPTDVPVSSQAEVKLGDGRILVVGGMHTAVQGFSTASWGNSRAEIFDASELEPVRPMNRRRMDAQATLLADGRVLVTGGATMEKTWIITQTSVTRDAEIFDPSTGTFTLIGPMRTPRYAHTATLLDDGRVLIAGGLPEAEFPAWPEPLATTEIFDPVSETFEPGPMMHAKRTGHTATRLDDGRVLIAGGRTWLAGDNPSLPSAEIFDGQFRRGPEIGARYDHTATRLADGGILFFGGASDAVVYDPRTDAIVDRTNLETPRREHAAALLPDGTVVVIGGRIDERYFDDVLRFVPSAPRRRAVR